MSNKKINEDVVRLEFQKKIWFDTVWDEKETRYYKEVRKNEFKRTIMLRKLELPKAGIIVGECFKLDGTYGREINRYQFGSCYGCDDDYEPSWFANEGRVDLWIVYTGMNELWYVPKHQKHIDQEHRYLSNCPKLPKKVGE